MENQAALAWSKVDKANRPFIKMHGLRNHFIIVDGRDKPYHPSIENITTICDTQIGVGGDQLLIIESPSQKGIHQGACAFMRILNIDGQEAEACGNATRCVAHLLLEEQHLDRVMLETRAGVLECRRVGEMSVSVNMGKIKTHWADIPLASKMDTRRLPIVSGPLKNPDVFSIGNPHAVFYVDDLSKIDMKTYAPAIQSHPLFPDMVNVGAAEIIDDSHMKLVVYERPGILTAACGSGACVAAYGAYHRGLIKSDKVSVELPGGNIEIEIFPNDTAVMTGPVAYCCSGHLLA